MLLFVVLVFRGTCVAEARTQATGALSTKNVLILHAFEANAPVFQETDRTLGSTLQAGGIPILNQSFRSLDLRRNPDPQYRKNLAEYMRTLYGHTRFDLIITMYPEALDFVLNEGRAILSNVPILALYMPADKEAPKTEHPIFWHASQLDLLGTLEMALKLVPGAKRVYVVSGAHESNRRQEEQARRALAKWDGRLEFYYVSHLPLNETLMTLGGAPRDAIVLLLPYSNDVTGTSYMAPDLTRQVSQASAAPVFGLLEVGLGHGIVGGSLFSFKAVGTNAGRLTLDILRGGSASGNVASILNVPAVPMFDWQQLKRWNLSVDAVPQGSRIINREYTLWERYGTEMIAAFFALVLQTLLIASLVVNRSQRQRAEQQLAEQLRIETLLAELSARFVHLPASQIEREIQSAQSHICQMLDLDRSSLWQVPPNEPDALRLTHLYTSPGTAPVPIRIDARDAVPWLLQKMKNGETVVISKLTALPPEAARDRESLQHYGTKSSLVVPLVIDGALAGALSFAMTRGEREWSERVVNGFQVIAQAVANAIARSRSDRALQESQARLTLAAASADARLWELEADTELVRMMEPDRAFFGVAPDEPLTLDRVSDFIHHDDRAAWRQTVRKALTDGEAMQVEFRVVRPDGSVRWVVAQGRLHIGGAGRPSRLLGLAIDITERKRAEERLRTSEALSAGILASLPGHLVIVDRSGAILRASDSWHGFATGDGAADPTVWAVGTGQTDAPQRAVEKDCPGAKEILAGVEAVLAGMQAEFRLEYPYPTHTEERWASVSVLSLQRPEGGAVIYRQDITLQQRSRLEAERLRRDLTHVGRVTAMGEMAAALAHELNQPLTAILSNAHAGERYLSQRQPPLDEIRDILQDVVGDARRAGEVIQRLRSLLRKEETRFVPLDVNQVIQEMAVLVHTDAILRNLVIALELAPDLPAVRGDRVQLQQVLLNLVLNSMEAMGPQGEGKRIVIRTQREDADVRIALRDEGHGIPAGDLSRVFETFYTTKAKGMGMGLAISRSLVEAHGGRIWAENNPDRGATLWFTLPACPSEPTTK